ncbi:Uncharacterised protein [Vibrio cholerae]|nr:Uncharacterised protein [Vibrio cholerae]
MVLATLRQSAAQTVQTQSPTAQRSGSPKSATAAAANPHRNCAQVQQATKR